MTICCLTPLDLSLLFTGLIDLADVRIYHPLLSGDGLMFQTFIIQGTLIDSSQERRI